MNIITSPNFGPRKHGLPPDLIVLHYTAMQSAQAAIDRLCDPKSEVSAHFVISETGEVSQLVDPDQRAWHAGAGSWGNITDVNSHSIGIELANAASDKDLPPFPAGQTAALVSVLKDMMLRYDIRRNRVIAHSDTAVGRKFDPGPKFDWRGLANAGLTIWPEAREMPEAGWPDFIRAAQEVGYHPPTDDASGWQAVLTAFRLRFAPAACGDLTASDIGLMTSLAIDHPCEPVDLGTPIA